jgi:hypothetical protein
MAQTPLFLMVFVVHVHMCLCTPQYELNTVHDLSKNYYHIFTSGNRNAASHLWTKFILDRASDMSAVKLETMFHGFCAISGSPLPDLSRTEYKVSLPKIGGGFVNGVTRHCCWPCVCDITELVRVDTKTISASDGPKTFHFLVIGDPCQHPEKLDIPYEDPFTGGQSTLANDAPEVKCVDGRLLNAIYSDHGYPIIGMLFDATTEQTQSEALAADPTSGFGQQCTARKEHGYNSGMGQIFHVVAKISPIPTGESFQQKFEVGKRVSMIGDSVASSAPATSFIPIAVLFMVVLTMATIAIVWIRRSQSGRSTGPNEHPSDDEMQMTE